MIHLVVFSFAGHHFGFEARQVVGMGHIAQLPPEGWQQVSLQAVLADAPRLTPAQATFWLQLRAAGSVNRLLLLKDRAQLTELSAQQVWPLPAVLQQGRRHRCIKALAWHENRPILLLDPALLPIL